MVSNPQSSECSGANRALGRWVGKAPALAVALSFAVLSGCVSHSGRSPDEARFKEILAQLPSQQAEEAGASAGKSSAGDYHLHVVGLVECKGFLSKTQTVYGEAWATHPGPDGPRVDVRHLKLRIHYLDGLFGGLSTDRAVAPKQLARKSDVIHGNFTTPLCTCARFVASASLPDQSANLRARTEVCPTP